jgi:hypothetical protein
MPGGVSGKLSAFSLLTRPPPSGEGAALDATAPAVGASGALASNVLDQRVELFTEFG